MKTDKIIKCIREIEKSKKVKIDVNTIIIVDVNEEIVLK